MEDFTNTFDIRKQPVPLRKAPLPPEQTQMSKPSNSQSRYGIIASKIFQPNLRRQNAKKRAAPPRPPPPSLNNVVRSESIPSFGIAKNLKTSNTFNGRSLLASNLKQSINEACLIDLSSPPNSPYAGSGSDGVSINSFSSENSSNNHSASEDVFDPFGLTSETPTIEGSSSFYCRSNGASLAVKPVVATSWDDDDPFREIALRHQSAPKVNLPPPRQSSYTQSMKSDSIAKITHPPTQTVPAATFYTKEDSSKPLRTTIIRPKNQTKITASQSCSQLSSSAVPSEKEFEEEKKLNNLDMQFAEALHDYVSAENGDLSLRVGQKVEIIRKVNDDWLYGKTTTGEGMFPRSFVKIMPTEPSIQPQRDTCSDNSHLDIFVSVLFTFPCQVAGDLALQVGETVHVLGKINDEWLYGEVNGMRGQFPTNYVENVPTNLPDWVPS